MERQPEAPLAPPLHALFPAVPPQGIGRTLASATLLFCPPLRVYIGCSASGPLTPKLPRRALCPPPPPILRPPLIHNYELSKGGGVQVSARGRWRGSRRRPLPPPPLHALFPAAPPRGIARTLASATLLFCPPLSVYIGCSASGPLTPKLPRCARASCSFKLGYEFSMICTGLRAKSRPSTWCWLKTASRTCKRQHGRHDNKNQIAQRIKR
jgi:hypothetical protein